MYDAPNPKFTYRTSTHQCTYNTRYIDSKLFWIQEYVHVVQRGSQYVLTYVALGLVSCEYIKN